MASAGARDCIGVWGGALSKDPGSRAPVGDQAGKAPGKLKVL